MTTFKYRSIIRLVLLGAVSYPFATGQTVFPPSNGGGGGLGSCALAGGTTSAATVDNGLGCPVDSTVIISGGAIAAPGAVSAGGGGTTPGQITIQANSGSAAAVPVSSWGFGPMPSTMTTTVLLVPPNSVPGTNTLMLLGTPVTGSGYSESPISYIGTQGTDSKLLTSGTVSGTGALLCTDSGGGATTSGCGSTTTFQTNGTGLSSSGTINFENSSATDGLTLTFANPSAGNVQLGFTGSLTVPGGGTGLTTLTSNTLYKGAGTSAMAVSTATDNGTTFAISDNLFTVGSNPPSVTAGTGGGQAANEGTAPTGASSVDFIYADSTAHRWKMINNNGTGTQVVASGADINTSDQVVTTHLTSIGTSTNCSSSASPAVCSAAPAGSIAIPTGTVSVALQVNTTAITASSQIFVFPDDTLGTKLSVTCNSTLSTLVGGLAITARSAGSSFTVTYNGTIATNPLCANFLVIN